MRYATSFFIMILLALNPLSLWSAPGAQIQPAVDRFVLETNGTAKVSFNKSTGSASYVRLLPGSIRIDGTNEEAQARDFFHKYGEIFGVSDGENELVAIATKIDRQGTRNVKFQQIFNGVEVFGAQLLVNFDANGKLTTINGTFIPNIKLTTVPLFTIQALKDTVKNHINAQFPDAAGLVVKKTNLYVYRKGLLQGIKGQDHLVYEIEISNNSNVREFVYIDAKTGKVVNQITGIYDTLDRRAFDAEDSVEPYPNYPNSPFWLEGDSLPTSSQEADNMIISSGETYDLFFNAFGRDSFDGNGATMDAIFNRGNRCPNASWNGIYISFCPGTTTDDIIAHEWGHAYTELTHGLIYQWQPGALNEAYSDIWGDVVDSINGRGTDSPAPIRTVDSCSVYGGAPPPTLTISGSGSANGSYSVTGTGGRPLPPFITGPSDLVLSTPLSACSAISDVTGKIVIVDYTLLSGVSECSLATRTDNALNAGAAGIIFVAPPTGLVNMTSRQSISVQVSNADGEMIKSGLPASATFEFLQGTEDSVRWLNGEDATAFGGSIRDMWNPNCFNDPGKVTDTIYYKCSTSDHGGVHTNSGIPNHEFTLLVDGGTYNGQTISPIGLIKASNIFFRAMTNYQVKSSGFAEHADAMDASCDDLRVAGTNLPDLLTGLPSGDVITSADCAQVAKAALATELRTSPTFCNFEPLLDPVMEPVGCAAPILQETFEMDPLSTWTLTNTGVFKSYTPRDWELTDVVPIGASGMAMFAVDGQNIGDCAADDQSGAMHLDSPIFTVPVDATNPVMTFDHFVATEIGYDGGNVKISINGGNFQIIDPADYSLNAYNDILIDASGNTNPLAGDYAFSGTDGGEVSGSWGQSRIMLDNYTEPGDEVQIRFDFGVDGCGGVDGWYIDNVNVCTELDFPIFANGFEQVSAPD